MTNFKNRYSRLKKNFFSTKIFLAFISGCLIAASVFLWRTQESRNLAQLYLQTESKAIALSGEMEIKYRGIYNALNRLANKGIPDGVQNTDEWAKDAAFFIDSFEGLKSIAWVDKSFFIKRIVPLQENEAYINRKANDVILNPSDVNLWIPVYKGTELVGFILGTITIDTFIAPLISNIQNDYMLQLSNEGKPVFTSGNWNRPQEGFVVNQTVTWQNTAVFNLSFAPTHEHLNSEIADAGQRFLFSLLFSFITIIAVYFAQNYNALSRLNELRFRKLLEDAQLVAVILDVDGRVTFCNDYLLTLTGWKREEVLGRDWFTQFVPPDWVQVKDMMLTALPGGNLPIYYENPILARTGERHWVLFNNTILRDIKGKIIGVACLGEDTTKRKQAEEALRTSEDKFKYVFESANVGKSITFPSGEINANKAFADMLGYTPPELQGRTWQELTPADELETTQRVIDSLLKGEKDSARFSKRYIHKNGSCIWADVSAVMRRDGEGKPLHFITTIVDITERKRVEEEIITLNAELERRVAERTAQLQTVNKELEAFAYSVSHDLRAPLRGIDGFTRILVDEYQAQLDDEGKRVCAIIRENTRRMGQLIDDLLAFSRLGRAELNKSIIDMKTMVNSIYYEVTSAELRAGITLQIGDICNACGDPTLMRQVWINLLSNAVKFISKTETPTIRVSCHEEGGKCVYCVKDNGAGFDMKYVNKLFGVFQRLHSAKDFEGTGVGLAIIQRIVNRHGGEVWAEGEVGKGAAFYFSLPVHSQDKSEGETNGKL